MTRSLVVISTVVALSSACAAEPSYEDMTRRIQTANDVLLNQGDVERVAEFFAPTYVLHAMPDDIRGGPEIIQNFVSGLRTAFPDLRVEVEILVVDDDRVAWRRRHRGTHSADFMGVPASGRVVEWQDVVVTRYDGDKIAEEWGVSDLGTQLRM